MTLGEMDSGPVVATTSDDRTARLWNARTGEPLLTLEGHDGMVWGVTLGELDSRPVVATVSGDRTARVWDARSGKE